MSARYFVWDGWKVRRGLRWVERARRHGAGRGMVVVEGGPDDVCGGLEGRRREQGPGGRSGCRPHTETLVRAYRLVESCKTPGR